MAESFLGEIRMFAGTFPPRGWALCDGQLLAIDDYDLLYSLLGTTYGGDGQTTFGLPEMRGRIPVHPGTGNGLTPQPWGGSAGQEAVTLAIAEMPLHYHGPFNATDETGNSTSPESRTTGVAPDDIYTDETPDVAFHAAAVTDVGGSQSHNNMMPYMCVNFIISLSGTYPSRI